MTPGCAAGLTSGVALDVGAGVDGVLVTVVKTVTVGAADARGRVIGPAVGGGGAAARSRWADEAATDDAATGAGATVTVTVVVTGVAVALDLGTVGLAVVRPVVVGLVVTGLVVPGLVVAGLVVDALVVDALVAGGRTAVALVEAVVRAGVVTRELTAVVGRMVVEVVATDGVGVAAGEEPIASEEGTELGVLTGTAAPAPTAGQGGSCCDVSRVTTALASASVLTGMPALTWSRAACTRSPTLSGVQPDWALVQEFSCAEASFQPSREPLTPRNTVTWSSWSPTKYFVVVHM